MSGCRALVFVLLLVPAEANSQLLPKDERENVCPAECRHTEYKDTTFAIPKRRGLHAGEAPPPVDPGHGEYPQPIDTCGNQVCFLSAVTGTTLICDGNPLMCFGAKLEVSDVALLGAVLQCANWKCSNATFPPFLFRPIKEVSFPSGTKLSGNTNITPIPEPPAPQEQLRLNKVFINYGLLRVETPLYLKIDEDGFLIGNLPKVSTPTDLRLTISAHNSQGEIKHSLIIHVIPLKNAAASGGK